MKRAEERQFVLVILCIVFLCVAVATYYIGYNEKIVFAEHLDEPLFRVDDAEYLLRDLAVYVVYEETLVQEQAKVYDAQETKAYWNIHTNGTFISVQARDTAIDMAIHDAIFYQMAQEEKLVLTEEEKTYLANEQMDFWSDLEPEQIEKLGISQEEADAVLEHMALAQKMQALLAERGDKSYNSYEINNISYEEILSGYDVWKNKRLIERLSFGSIILEH